MSSANIENLSENQCSMEFQYLTLFSVEDGQPAHLACLYHINDGCHHRSTGGAFLRCSVAEATHHRINNYHHQAIHYGEGA